MPQKTIPITLLTALRSAPDVVVEPLYCVTTSELLRAAVMAGIMFGAVFTAALTVFVLSVYSFDVVGAISTGIVLLILGWYSDRIFEWLTARIILDERRKMLKKEVNKE